MSSDGVPDVVFMADVSDVRQQMEAFGASDAWVTKYVGVWPEDVRSGVAELLFSREVDEDGDPKGAGLSGWRYNIGAGSIRKDNVRSHNMKADIFLNEELTDYDWSRQAGSTWFLEQAHKYGVHEVTGFCNSPPFTMTKNGMTFVTPGERETNLRDDKYDDFAEFIATVAKHFEERGLGFKFISPVNEPQWDWNGPKQEGSPYGNGQIARLVRELHRELGEAGVSAEILINDSGQIDWLYDWRDGKGNYIGDFFDRGSDNYIGDKVADRIASHSYWTDQPGSGLVEKRQRLAREMAKYPALKYEMSEYCILGPEGPGRDLGIEPAMRMARTVHYDLTVADAVSWYWWLGISAGNYKDGLVYVDRRDKAYHSSKLLWGIGNYSRFVRPGMARVAVRRSDGKGPAEMVEGLMLSAFYDKNAGRVVAVVLNYAEEAKTFELKVKRGARLANIAAVPYVTSSEYDLKAGKVVSGVMEVPGRSIVTLVSSL